MKPRPRGFFARWRRDQNGASAVEFAIVSTPLLLFMFGILEFGRAIWIEQALQSTAARTARCIALKIPQTSACSSSNINGCGCYDSSGNYSTSNTVTFAQYVAKQWGVTLTSSNITQSNQASCNVSGSTSFAQATINYTFNPVTTLIPGLQTKAMQSLACFPMNS